MPAKNVVKHGDVNGRVGVEVIRARGVDVEKLIKMLVANAAAERFKQQSDRLEHSTPKRAAGHRAVMGRQCNRPVEHWRRR